MLNRGTNGRKTCPFEAAHWLCPPFPPQHKARVPLDYSPDRAPCNGPVVLSLRQNLRNISTLNSLSVHNRRGALFYRKTSVFSGFRRRSGRALSNVGEEACPPIYLILLVYPAYPAFRLCSPRRCPPCPLRADPEIAHVTVEPNVAAPAREAGRPACREPPIPPVAEAAGAARKDYTRAPSDLIASRPFRARREAAAR